MTTSASPWKVLPMNELMNKVGLPCISRAGFNYDLDAYSDETSELADAMKAVLDPAEPTPLAFVAVSAMWYLPILQHLPLAILRNTNRALKQLQKIARDILAQASSNDVSIAGRNSLLGRLLSASSEAANQRDRLSDEELLAQIVTFVRCEDFARCRTG